MVFKTNCTRLKINIKKKHETRSVFAYRFQVYISLFLVGYCNDCTNLNPIINQLLSAWLDG